MNVHLVTICLNYIFLCSFLQLTLKATDNWNQFRGPNGSGIANEKFIPPINISKKHIAWSSNIPEGLSSPVIYSDKIFLTAFEKDRLVTICINSTNGNLEWKTAAPKCEIEKVHKTSSPASSTPYVDKDHVYVYFGSYGLICYDHNGIEKWSKSILTPKSLYGMSTSPLVYKNKVILVVDNDANIEKSRLSQSKIIALNKSNGEIIWSAERPHHRSGWSSPIIWKHDKGSELIVLGNEKVRSYNPETGSENWYAGGFSRETIAVPVVGNNHVFVSSAQLGGVPDKQIDPAPFWKALIKFDKNNDGKISRDEMTDNFTYPLRPELPLGHPGFGIPMPDNPQRKEERINGILRWVDKNGDKAWTKEEFINHMSFRRGRPILLAIKPGGEGNIEKTHVSWELNKSIPEIPSPLFYRDIVYLVRNGGILAAIDSETGEQLYRERVTGSGQYSASPISANGHIFLVSNRGQVSTIKPGRKFEQIHSYEIGESVFVTPAIDSNTIYFRGQKKLWAFRNSE